MALPIAPIAWNAARIGGLAALAWYVRSRNRTMPKHVWREAAMDDLNDGVEITSDRGEAERNTHASARLRRSVRLGPLGEVELDLSAIGRLRVRRL